MASDMKINSVLVHCCCAHCTAYTINYWQQKGYEPSTLWYNPNIHPYTEHQARLGAMQFLAKEKNFPLITIKGYNIKGYFRRVTGNEDQRCRNCFQIRLQRTAEDAMKLGFSAFTSSLLISPHQKHKMLAEIGNDLAEKIGIPFIYADLRKYYSDSRRITKSMNLYRQQYCGCIYSEWERYAGINIE